MWAGALIEILGVWLWVGAPTPASQVAVIREADSPVGSAVVEALVGDPDREVTFVVHERPAEASRLELARRVCSDGRTRGVYWFDTRRTDQFWVVLLQCPIRSGEGEKVRVREVPVDPAAEQAAIEEMWLIARASATALVSGEAIAMEERDAASVEPESVTKAQPRPTPRPAEPAPARRPRPKLRVVASYGGDALARVVPWQHAIAAGFAVEPLKLLRVGIEYGFVVPADVRGEPELRTWRHLVALQIGVFGGTDRVTVEGRASAELELQRWKSDDRPDAGVRPVPKAGLDVLLAIRLWRGLFLELGPGLAVPLARVDVVRCRTGAASCTGVDRRVAVAPWPVRPRARIGLGVRF